MLRLGVDYYPEHWPRERWTTDAAMMQKAGITMARLAEFAWSKMEPAEGSFDFSWLREAVGTLDDHGIRVVLGTPTATPPAWLIKKHPDILPHDAKGHITPFGNRRHYCFNSATYWRHCDRIVNAMVREFGLDPRVAAWQTDNEFGGRCYCPRCESAFREWLKRRYRSLDTLNKAWGTIFWSQEYSDWTQIPAAKHDNGSNNPGLHLDWCRFSSESIVRFQKRQIDIIKTANPAATVTHNTMTMGIYDSVDLHDMCADLDVASWDNYPMWTTDEVAPAANAMMADCARGLKRKNFWVMEQQSGAGGWRAFGRFPAPGEIRLWSYQSVGRGADAVIYFRWRTALFGTEQYWHGILDHAGIPNRRYAEVQRVGEEFAAIGAALDATAPVNEIAFVNTYDSRWALSIQPGNGAFDYFKHVEKWYRPLFCRGIGADFVNRNAPLDSYKVVFIPTLHLVTDALARQLTAYVENGGMLVATYRTGVKTVDNQVIDRPLPGLLAGLFGCEVEEYQCLEKMPDVTVALAETVAKKIIRSTVFNDVLKLTKAKAIARYGSEHYKGKPAITVNKFGTGLAVYVGFEANDDFYALLVPWLLKQAHLPVPARLPAKVEHAVRENAGKRFHFWLNYNEKPVRVPAGKGGKDLLTGKKKTGEISLERFGAAILEEPKAAAKRSGSGRGLRP